MDGARQRGDERQRKSGSRSGRFERKSDAETGLSGQRNGFYYTLDRTNGSFISAAQYMANVNWTKGIDLKNDKLVEYDPSKKLQQYAVASSRSSGEFDIRLHKAGYERRMRVMNLPLAGVVASYVLLCPYRRAAVEPQRGVAVALGRQGRRDWDYHYIVWRFVFLGHQVDRLAERGADAGAFSICIGQRLSSPTR